MALTVSRLPDAKVPVPLIVRRHFTVAAPGLSGGALAAGGCSPKTGDFEEGQRMTWMTWAAIVLSGLVRRVIHLPQCHRQTGMPARARWPFALIALALALQSPVAKSTSICRWIDQSGRTQMSDVVPEQYKQSASCSDSRKYELSPDQQHEAEQRAVDVDRSLRPELAEPPAPVASSAPAAPAAPAIGSWPGAKRPAEIITDATSCPTRWRIYDEAIACFGPYRTTRGATKPEGFDRCNDIPSPEIKCGPRRD